MIMQIMLVDHFYPKLIAINDIFAVKPKHQDTTNVSSIA